MKLITDWRTVVCRSYSMLAFVVLAFVTLLPDAIYKATGVDTNPAMWSTLQYWVIFLGLIGRVIQQTEAGAWLRRVVVSVLVLVTVLLAAPVAAQTTERATMRVLTPLVIQWEGEHRCADNPAMHCAYRDIVGVPTICYGETKGVRIGDRATGAACRLKLEQRLTGDFRAGLHGYFSADTRAKRLTPERDAAYVSLAYNVGIRGAGRSTATRRLNAGDVAGGCKALTWWNKAGGRVVRGLVNRRAHEHALCMKGVK